MRINRRILEEVIGFLRTDSKKDAVEFIIYHTGEHQGPPEPHLYRCEIEELVDVMYQCYKMDPDMDRMSKVSNANGVRKVKIKSVKKVLPTPFLELTFTPEIDQDVFLNLPFDRAYIDFENGAKIAILDAGELKQLDSFKERCDLTDGWEAN